MQWGIGSMPSTFELDREDPFPNIPTHTIPKTKTQLSRTTNTWPDRLWFRFYNDKGTERDIFLENVQIDDKDVKYKKGATWKERSDDQKERIDNDSDRDYDPHPFGMYWNMTYELLITTKGPDDDDDFPWLWVGLGAGAFFLFFMLMMMMMMMAG